MNKAELIAAIAAKTGDTKKAAEASVNAFVEVVTDALKEGDTGTNNPPSSASPFKTACEAVTFSFAFLVLVYINSIFTILLSFFSLSLIIDKTFSHVNALKH